MNKTQLVQELTERLGDHKTAAIAVDEVLAAIVRTVQSGESVTLTGFGVFERRERAARTGRNPQTGETLELAATAVPAFRPGAEFRGVVGGSRELAEPSVLGPRRTSTAQPTAARRRPAPTSAAASMAAAPVAPPKPGTKSRPAKSRLAESRPADKPDKPDKKAKGKADSGKGRDKGKKSGGKKAAKR